MKNNKNWRKILVATILASMLVLTGCNKNEQPNNSSSDSSTPESSVESSSEGQEEPGEEPEAMAIDYAVVSENFFGVWEDVSAPEVKIYLGLGSASFDGVHTYIREAAVGEDNSAVMQVVSSGEPYAYVINADDKMTMTVTSVNDASQTATYKKTGEIEATDVFGYFNVLNFAAQANILEKEELYNAFFFTKVTLEDGTVWERMGTMEYDLPELHIVENKGAEVKLTSMFFPEGTELDQNSLSVAQSITFTVAAEDGKIVVKNAAVA